MPNPFGFLAVPANSLVTGLAQLIQAPFGPYATAMAIVLGTLVVRLFLLPLGYAQHRADQRRNALLGKVAELRRRHARHPQRLESELNGLYRAEGGSLARGCLPLLLQIPIFAGLYPVFASPTISGQANLLLQQTLFGVPLGTHLLAASGPQLLVFGAMILLLVAIGFVSSRVLRPKEVAAEPVDWAARLVPKVVPYLTAAFAVFLPLAASLYLVTTTAWTVAQTVALRHWIS
jgi:YidC/Oxa1 family membrane protein insertase